VRLRLDKKISSDNKNYSDNIGFNDKVFNLSDEVYFQVLVENNGGRPVGRLRLIDTLPSDLTLSYYPGRYDQGGRLISWEIEGLGVGETRYFQILGRINREAGVTKKINMVKLTGDNVYLNDSSYYYVGKEQMPDTGPSDIWWRSLTMAGLAGAMVILRKLTRGY